MRLVHIPNGIGLTHQACVCDSVRMSWSLSTGWCVNTTFLSAVLLKLQMQSPCCLHDGRRSTQLLYRQGLSVLSFHQPSPSKTSITSISPMFPNYCFSLKNLSSHDSVLHLISVSLSSVLLPFPSLSCFSVNGGNLSNCS